MANPIINPIIPFTNTPQDLIDYCKANDIFVETYSPIGHGVLFKNEQVAEMDKIFNVSVPQLGLKYDLQPGLLPLPKTTNPNYLKNNGELNFEISAEDTLGALFHVKQAHIDTIF